MDELSFSDDDFSGVVRLFPLPNLVMFPHVIQPLHLFEPRYLELMEEALAGDRLIAMCVLQPGWEKEYDARPAVYPMACLGRIASHHRIEDGKFNLLLAGVRRVQIVRELEPTRAFREAEAAIRADYYPAATATYRTALQQRLRKAFEPLLPDKGQTRELIDEVLGRGVSLGMLTDVIAYTMDLPVGFKRTLLGEPNVDRRAKLLVERLNKATAEPAAATAYKFPPDFSAN